MAPILLLLGFVYLVEADWAEVEASSDGAAYMLQHNAKPLEQVNHGFINLHMIYVESSSRARQEEYCVSIRENARNHAVREVNLVTSLSKTSAWSSMIDTCQLPQDLHRKIKVHGDYSEKNGLTYKTLLSIASSVASATTLQVVMNTDIILSDKFATLKHCLEKTRHQKEFFHLTRSEPETCYPLLDGLPRTRNTSDAPDEVVYMDLCAEKVGGSHDALAFSLPIPAESLNLLDFPPNRLGAENVVSCRLFQAGFKLQNPCSDLPIYHNHCSDQRSYNSSRIDLEGNAECAYFFVPVKPLDKECSAA
eukprot:CAMPEP_0197636428 /NCGR_PEP_ID=MMETSP1338-20131121/11943_1 /TAXON_ID=43686 ORGANISM="Pelagodinium beii, Strain RCC1491" /NCGR_SAMPLE_ID=MMETSP1338 /ASSEMBLY_ACC=CAM_ASM_000754 /LENGTH=306 /DNA_ID=CAMNT_0043208659 /DNA_START=98 /DNA_END=1018 /DNA_ORIENTATION=-